MQNTNYTLKIKDITLDKETIKKLEEYQFTVYWNDVDCDYWIFDFKVNNIWFTSYKIDMNKKIIYLKKF